MRLPPYDPTDVLKGLKDFQRESVDYVFRRLYTDPNPTRRFLVADEVGLGKTLVARGLIAKAVQHLQIKGVRRIDVVYICSNADIAAQNIGKLTLPGFNAFTKATRLTLLPLELRDLSREKLNFVAFTPQTSLNLRSSMGISKERALLHVLLQEAWGARAVSSNGAYRVLQGWVKDFWEFKGQCMGLARQELDRSLVGSFCRAIERHDKRAVRAGNTALQGRFEELSARFRSSRNRPTDEDWAYRSALVGDFRQILARTCLDALEPDLVILDEFQRFRDLLDGNDPASELAHDLFNYKDVRVLLLSATPYKMYSLSDESDDDHYRDFLRTAGFLMEGETEKFSSDLSEFRRSLIHLGAEENDNALLAKQKVEKRLRRVMVRTERLALTADRGGMLAEKPFPEVRLEPRDVLSFLSTDRISQRLGAGNVIEYWKSAPYLLNFMDGYKLAREFEALDGRTSAWRDIRPELEAGAGFVHWEDFKRYREIDPDNARLRGLTASTVGVGAWKLLWLLPALPYYTVGTPFDSEGLQSFSKRLVFSSWNVVPKVIASLMSYDAERRMMTAKGSHPENSLEARKRIKPLLQFKESGSQLSGLTTFALVYPSPTLAILGDPLRVSADMGFDKEVAPREELLDEIERRIAFRLQPLIDGAPEDGSPDSRWYWAAPMLLDDAAGVARQWFDQNDLADQWMGRDGNGTSEDDGGRDPAFGKHLSYAKALIFGASRDDFDRSVRPLGRVPDDLAQVLAEIAVGAPGMTSLRALNRNGVSPESIATNEVRNSAGSLAWGFRNLFNLPEVTTLIRATFGKDPYWRRVLRYCVNGCLQSVLDEYAHVLREWLGIVNGDHIETSKKVAQAAREAVTLRTVGYGVRNVPRFDGDPDTYRFRCRFALRFGSERSEEERDVQRASAVRASFNSPFWPFVLATTSVGQEGLDFHLYCHSIVHWNLPNNPVDLEQREGRIHRYKGHAVRKNLATKHRVAAFAEGSNDPWQALFDTASANRKPGENDLIPSWLFPIDNGATIDRYVPALPLSSEILRFGELKKSLALYRLVFGQPRQEDLVDYLLTKGFDDERIRQLVEELRIDLTPPRIGPD